MSIGSFELNIQQFVDKAKGNIDLVLRKISLDMFSRVIMKSPVDTGRFRANWQVTINSILSGTISAVDKSGGATLSRVSATTLGMKAGDTITLVNNLSYARGLEYGRSKQAPNGMVRITLQEFGAVVTAAAGSVPP